MPLSVLSMCSRDPARLPTRRATPTPVSLAKAVGIQCEIQPSIVLRNQVGYKELDWS